MGDMINSVGIGGASGYSWDKSALPKAEKDIVVSDTFTPSGEAETEQTGAALKAQATGETKPRRANVVAAKDFINKAVKKLEAARPDFVDSEKVAKEAAKVIESMEPNIQRINLDFVIGGEGTDVSGEGKSVRSKGKEADGIMSKGTADVGDAKNDLTDLDKDIQGALESVTKAIKQKEEEKGTGLLQAKYELEQVAEQYRPMMTDVNFTDRYFSGARGNVAKMGPFLDIVEKDTVQSDVGRFAKDLGKLQDDARFDMLEGGLVSKFTYQDIDLMKGRLEKALKYLG